MKLAANLIPLLSLASIGLAAPAETTANLAIEARQVLEARGSGWGNTCPRSRLLGRIIDGQFRVNLCAECKDSSGGGSRVSQLNLDGCLGNDNGVLRGQKNEASGARLNAKSKVLPVAEDCPPEIYDLGVDVRYGTQMKYLGISAGERLDTRTFWEERHEEIKKRIGRWKRFGVARGARVRGANRALEATLWHPLRHLQVRKQGIDPIMKTIKEFIWKIEPEERKNGRCANRPSQSVAGID
ncbi:uncharacterized protein DNG_04607 [Cephalotrichum gorgonifer]|uniref:Uncharacterized protein n=1 Tax=Cephalotrichum gorgonifer TaxID=2041049 RepID=A0AAE8SV27_9PEZI|nr:uncharacterized protein DNG_04607 [Cephalotrichum gorgonifer]